MRERRGVRQRPHPAGRPGPGRRRPEAPKQQPPSLPGLLAGDLLLDHRRRPAPRRPARSGSTRQCGLRCQATAHPRVAWARSRVTSSSAPSRAGAVERPVGPRPPGLEVDLSEPATRRMRMVTTPSGVVHARQIVPSASRWNAGSPGPGAARRGRRTARTASPAARSAPCRSPPPRQRTSQDRRSTLAPCPHAAVRRRAGLGRAQRHGIAAREAADPRRPAPPHGPGRHRDRCRLPRRRAAPAAYRRRLGQPRLGTRPEPTEPTLTVARRRRGARADQPRCPDRVRPRRAPRRCSASSAGRPPTSSGCCAACSRATSGKGALDAAMLDAVAAASGVSLARRSSGGDAARRDRTGRGGGAHDRSTEAVEAFGLTRRPAGPPDARRLGAGRGRRPWRSPASRRRSTSSSTASGSRSTRPATRSGSSPGASTRSPVGCPRCGRGRPVVRAGRADPRRRGHARSTRPDGPTVPGDRLPHGDPRWPRSPAPARDGRADAVLLRPPARRRRRPDRPPAGRAARLGSTRWCPPPTGSPGSTTDDPRPPAVLHGRGGGGSRRASWSSRSMRRTTPAAADRPG